MACCGVCFRARVCVTVIGLGQSSFLCPRVSSVLLQLKRAPLHVVIVLLCVVVGAIQFLECLSVFSHPPLPLLSFLCLLIYQHFFDCYFLLLLYYCSCLLLLFH